jgi:O-methyltransferase
MHMRSTVQLWRRRLRLARAMARSPHERFLADVEQLVAIDALTDARARLDAEFTYLSHKAARMRLAVYNRNLMWFDEPAFWQLWTASPYCGRQRPDRKFVLWSMARSVSHIAGDTAECGVLDGASSYLICAARRSDRPPLHHAFDSFEGLSVPSPEDHPAIETSFTWTAGDLSVSLDEAQAKLGQFDNIRYYKGWIPTRFDEIADRRFSFVHVDVDLYAPTRDSLEFFYPRLMPGGILLCDDYGYHTCPGARRAFDEFISDKPEEAVVHLPTGQGFIVKRTLQVSGG